ncbi:MAG: amidohydrolase [Candidatus Bipolaricaulia bacterium]
MVTAEAVFRRGRIYTLDAKNTVAQALAVRDGKILAVGSNEEMKALSGPHTKVFDLEGRTVLPGFHDAHCHVLLFGFGLLQIDLRSATRIADIVQAVSERVKQTPKGEWVRGWGYNDNKLQERRHPTRHDLDPISTDHPVFLVHVSGHMSVANSKALECAGITRETPNPEGGLIERDTTGEPTGVLKETAQELVKRVLPPYSLEEAKHALAAANKRFLSEGITSVQDAWAGWIVPQEFRAYQEAVEEGLLQVRVALMPDVESLPVKDGRFDFGWGLHTGFGSERVKLGPIKIFLDGSLIGRTAALTQPYACDPNTKGFLVKSEERIFEQVCMAHAGGWQVAMHTIGDRAIEVGLEAIERAMGQDAHKYRPRLEHCGVLRPDLIARMKQLGVVIVTQPHFIWELGDGFRWALGEERLQLTYPLASLRGLPVAFSSDRPVVEGKPLIGIQAAICQKTQTGAFYVPHEKITIGEALRWYTVGAAYSIFEEQIKGTLEPGKLADFIVLSEDPFEVEPEQLSAIQVLATAIGGKIVYEI